MNSELPPLGARPQQEGDGTDFGSERRMGDANVKCWFHHVHTRVHECVCVLASAVGHRNGQAGAHT